MEGSTTEATTTTEGVRRQAATENGIGVPLASTAHRLHRSLHHTSRLHHRSQLHHSRRQSGHQTAAATENGIGVPLASTAHRLHRSLHHRLLHRLHRSRHQSLPHRLLDGLLASTTTLLHHNCEVDQRPDGTLPRMTLVP